MKAPLPLLAAVALAGICAAQSASATNYFNWGVENETTSIGALSQSDGLYGDFTSRDCTAGVARSGSCSMKISIPTSVGDPSNIGSGAKLPRSIMYKVPAVGSGSIYYRWGMKIMPGFNWGNGQAKTKSSRVFACPDSNPDCAGPQISGPQAQGYTGYIMSYGFLIGECDQSAVCLLANGTSNGSDSGLVIPYDFTSKADGKWHEYIVRVKPNTSAACTPKVDCDAEFEAWVDGVKVGQYMNFRLSTRASNYKAVELWGGWMVSPYFQFGGSTSGYGGTMYLDDFSTDDTWNSLVAGTSTSGGTTGGSTTTTPPPSSPPVSGPPPSGSSGECSASNQAWIWCDDFESGSISTAQGGYFEYDNNAGDFIPVSGAGKDGSYGMRARWQAGEVGAGDLKLVFGRNPLANRGIRSSEDFREIYYRVYVKTQSGWSGDPGKLSRATVFAKNDWSQAMIAHLWGGASNGTLAIDPVTCVSGSTVTCAGYNDFNHLQWLGLKNGGTALFASTNANKWYCVEAHVKLNDAGQANGIQEFWVDGNLEARSANLDFVGSYTAYGLNAVLLENYWNSSSPKLQERYFDNFVVSTQRIGCGTPLLAPKPPTAISVQ
jgi:hypothetical protein